MTIEGAKYIICECYNSSCPVHPGESKCDEWASRWVQEIKTGRAFDTCELCTETAVATGLFEEVFPSSGEAD